MVCDVDWRTKWGTVLSISQFVKDLRNGQAAEQKIVGGRLSNAWNPPEPLIRSFMEAIVGPSAK
jgi:hypothetical protein